MGQLYQQGKGVSQNYSEALKWYMAASAKDDPEAKYRLGFDV